MESQEQTQEMGTTTLTVSNNKYSSFADLTPVEERLYLHIAKQQRDNVRKLLNNYPELLLNDGIAATLLYHFVYYGQQDNAEELLQKKPYLLRERQIRAIPEILTDKRGELYLSGNRYKININAFQYAVWYFK